VKEGLRIELSFTAPPAARSRAITIKTSGTISAASGQSLKVMDGDVVV
jgi:hypothetical protein